MEYFELSHNSIAYLLIRDSQQITFVMVNIFCPLSNPQRHPTVNGQYQNQMKNNQNQMKNKSLFTLHFQF